MPVYSSAPLYLPVLSTDLAQRPLKGRGRDDPMPELEISGALTWD